MSTHPNNSPEQKKAWKANQRIGSRFIRVIPAPEYEAYRRNPANDPQYDSTGRRVK